MNANQAERLLTPENHKKLIGELVRLANSAMCVPAWYPSRAEKWLDKYLTPSAPADEPAVQGEPPLLRAVSNFDLLVRECEKCKEIHIFGFYPQLTPEQKQIDRERMVVVVSGDCKCGAKVSSEYDVFTSPDGSAARVIAKERRKTTDVQCKAIELRQRAEAAEQEAAQLRESRDDLQREVLALEDIAIRQRAEVERLREERNKLLTNLRTIYREADDERLEEGRKHGQEAERWKADGDWFGWNFHKGYESGTVAASFAFYRVAKAIDAALAERGQQPPTQGANDG